MIIGIERAGNTDVRANTKDPAKKEIKPEVAKPQQKITKSPNERQSSLYAPTFSSRQKGEVTSPNNQLLKSR